MKTYDRLFCMACLAGALGSIGVNSAALAQDRDPVLPGIVSATTVPTSGDQNPYGVAFVPDGVAPGGLLVPGAVLASNFNASSNLQGTGSTIVQISPAGQTSVFFQGPSGLGLTTALGVLKSGVVLVGSLPTTDGQCDTVQPGALLIVDKHGRQIGSLADSALLDGPWDLTVSNAGDNAVVFVSNVLSGTVTRLTLQVSSDGESVSLENAVQIGSGYGWRCDPAALVVGPTGLAYDAHSGRLYVASTDDNAIYSIENAAGRQTDAGVGRPVYADPAHLHGPVGLALTPTGDLLATNGDAVNPDPNQTSELVEFTPSGRFVRELSVDPAPGAAFGIAVSAEGDSLKLAFVDDALNVLNVWTLAR